MDWRTAVNALNNNISTNYDAAVDRVLDRMGLEYKRSNTDYLMPALGIFGAGLVVGTALGLLLAPKRGEDLRHDLRHRIDDFRSTGVERYDDIRARHNESLEAGE